MTAIPAPTPTPTPTPAPTIDRFLDWAALRPNTSSLVAALVVGFTLWGALQPLPATAGGCAAPVIASVADISPATLV